MHRIWLSRVWKKHTQHRKNTFNFSLIFGLILASNGRKKRKKTAKAQKSLLAPSLGTPFWPQGRFWSIFWSRPGPKNEPQREKITTMVRTFIASKNQTHEFQRRSASGSHFETLPGGSREHSGPHFGDFRRFFGTVSKGIPSHNLRLKSSKKLRPPSQLLFCRPPNLRCGGLALASSIRRPCGWRLLNLCPYLI